MPLLDLMPFLELSPRGDGEFRLPAKDHLPRKITQKLPLWARHLPLRGISRSPLLYIKDSWNDFSSDPGAALVQGSVLCTGLPQGRVCQEPYPHLLWPWDCSPPGAQSSALPFFSAGLHSALSSVLVTASFGQAAGESLKTHQHPLLAGALNKAKSSDPGSTQPGFQIPERPSPSVWAWRNPSTSPDKGTVRAPSSIESPGKRRAKAFQVLSLASTGTRSCPWWKEGSRVIFWAPAYRCFIYTLEKSSTMCIMDIL